MENPATWGRAEQVISTVILEHWQEMSVAERMAGLSLERKIADRLRAEGLLREEGS
jgi:hypothetical protein